MTSTAREATSPFTVAFIGGGNMAQAIVGGLLQRAWPAECVVVVEPYAPTRAHLMTLGVPVLAEASAPLMQADVVVWAVKPQVFREAAALAKPHLPPDALHISIMAGVTLATLAQISGSPQWVRTMPNTPALIGLGMTGLTAAPGLDVSAKDKAERVLAGTGELQWFAQEADLDAVTALSGSGPAYVFYFLEALVAAGQDLGLEPSVARRLAVQTFRGASALAAVSSEPLEQLRERVTSKGGTTYAAITQLQTMQVADHIRAAAKAAHARAQELAGTS